MRAWEEVGVLVTKLQEPRTRLPLDPINARLNAFGAQLRAVFRLKQSEFTPESVIPEGDALRFWLTNFGSQVGTGGGGGVCETACTAPSQ